MVATEDPHPLGGTAIRPKEYKGMAGITHFLHDPDAGTFCSRTPKSWFLITVFYLIYYTCLAGFWTGMMVIFLTTVSYEHPKWTLDGSIIGTNPGLGLRPGQNDENVGSAMFLLRPNAKLPASMDEPTEEQLKDALNLGFASRLKKWMDKNNEVNDQAVDCAGDATPGEGQFCKFNMDSLGPCKDFPYGYGETNKPCVIIKLNKIWGWKPEFIESEEDFGDDEDWTDDAKAVLKERFGNKQVTVNCRGEYPADQEALKDKIKYFPPTQGIPLKYFPFDNINNTQSPLLAVQFEELKVGQLIHIECRAYFKGVYHSRKEKQGLVRFEIFYDQKNTEK